MDDLEQRQEPQFEYWAAKDTDSIAGALSDRVEDYYKYTMYSGLNLKWRRAYLNYYQNFLNNAQIQAAGERGEYSVINVAEAPNIIQNIINLVINDRPAWSPRAANGDVKSQRQVEFCKGLLDYYMREKRVEKDVYQAVEYAMAMGEGFVSVGWDSAAGSVYSFDPETQQPLNTGDLRYKTHEPIDIIRDTRLNTFRDRDWLIVREWQNKYNLMAKFPQFAREIDGIDCNIQPQYHYRATGKFVYATDVIPVFRFLHAKTAALPQGRLTLFLDDQTVLSDGQLPYRHIPVSRITPRDVMGQPFGHTPLFDLIPINDNLNMLYSTILTNQEAFGTQNIMVPAGSNIDVENLIGGLQLITYTPTGPTGGGKPEPAPLLETPPEIFNTVNTLTQAMERISGINTVTRGNAPTADSSGALAALIQQMAIDFQQPTQWSYVQLLEDVGTTTVQILQDFASIPRIVTIAGKNNRADTKEFKQDDIAGIDRVLVDSANPMSKTTPGKMQLIQLLMQAGVIKNPDEILQVLNTGTMDPMTQGKTHELLGLAAENESLVAGEQVPVIVTDDHFLHIQEHKSLLADPEARNDPNTVKVVLAHIQQHVQMLSDPNNASVLKLLGQPAISQGPPPGAPPQQGAPPNPQQMPGPQQNSAAMVQHMQPNMPHVAVNPMTHQPPTNNGGA